MSEKPIRVMGADGPVEASQMRLDIVIAEYPIMQPLYFAMRQATATTDHWIETAYCLKEAGNDERLEKLIEKDPNFLAKYHYMFVTAIVDNPTVSKELKRQVASIVFSEEENS